MGKTKTHHAKGKPATKRRKMKPYCLTAEKTISPVFNKNSTSFEDFHYVSDAKKARAEKTTMKRYEKNKTRQQSKRAIKKLIP